MGVLNVTPDSFSDGGLYYDHDAAVARAGEMIEEGAVIIDVGGASSRPRGSVYGEGADALSAGDEMARILPVVERIAAQWPETWISVDTYLPTVAEAVLKAGAHIINDITALRLHPEMANVVAGCDAALVLMHSVGTPGDMPHSIETEDIVTDVMDSLRISVSIAEHEGVDSLVLDPGFGFGKSVDDNLRLLGAVDRFLEMGRPILVGISRKSTIGAALRSTESPAPVEERLFGTLGATAVAVQKGASIVRTHDVKPTTEMLKVISATLEASGGTKP